MGRPLFCFTIDTEPDDLWESGSAPTFGHFARLPMFHQTLRTLGAKPTYLTTSEVVEDPSALRALMTCLEAGGCEVGAHFHTWTREWPFPVPALAGRPVQAMAHQLGPGLEKDMLEYTCQALDRAVGGPPNSYRAGRWSLASTSVSALVACGIRVDTTVTPGLSWRDHRNPLLDGPDYTHAPRVPYHLSVGQEVTVRRTRGEVLELPVGAAWTPSLCRRLAAVGGMQRAMRRLSRVSPLGFTWLRPLEQTTEQFVRCLGQLKTDGIPVWVSMTHSSEIAPCSRLPTEADVQGFVSKCTSLVEAAAAMGAQACTLSEAMRFYEHGSVSPLGLESDTQGPVARGDTGWSAAAGPK